MVKSTQQTFENARHQMRRSIPNIDAVPAILASKLEDPHWEEVARRCLSCASCTQVCPTCFCWDVHDHTDLTVSKARRERVWDSCFNPDYSYHAFGSTRPDTRARYRQWLTHKFSAWEGQFGTLGCIGCGRCITWCPAEIDVTQEVKAFLEEVSA